MIRMSGTMRWQFLGIGVLLSAVLATPGQSLAESRFPLVRPVVRLVLQNKATVEGTLVQFADCRYTLDVAGQSMVVSEADIASISFHCAQSPAEPASAPAPYAAEFEAALALCDTNTASLVKQLTDGADGDARNASQKLAAAEPGEALVAALMTAVRADEHNRYWPRIAHLMADWGENALEPLDQYASDTHWRVRRTVVMAWGRMNLQKLPQGMPAMLKDEEVLVRLSTAESLSKLFRTGDTDMVTTIVGLLIRAVEDESIQRTGWWHGASVMAEVSVSHPEAVDALITAMQSARGESLRGEAARALGIVATKLREDHEDVPRIAQSLAKRINGESDERTRVTVIHALGFMGPRAIDVLEHLVRATDDRSEWVSKAAHEAISKINP